MLATAVLALSSSLTLAPPGRGFLRTPTAAALENGLARKPPLIWQSWFAYGCQINQDEVKAAADAIVSSGLKAAGFKYVVIDDCWTANTRGPNGQIRANPTRFPSGMEALAAYVHSKGLKFGLYSSPQTNTCAGFIGSLGHEEQDAETFAKWGVDWLKYDTCGGGNVQENDETMLHALQATGRPIVFQTTSYYGAPAQYSWVVKDSNMWRSTGDIPESWQGVISVLDQQAGLSKYPQPGSWNELSNLFAAPPSLTPHCTSPSSSPVTASEWKAMYSLWALMMTPLQISDHPACIASSPFLKTTYTNRDILAVDQDWAGRVGDLVTMNGDSQVWAKPMPGGSVAVVLLNTGTAQNAVTVAPQKLGLQNSPAYLVRDLWTHRNTTMQGGISATVPAQGARMFQVWPAHPNAAPAAQPTLSVGGTDWLTGGQPGTVTTTLDNVGNSAITHIHLSLQAPSGWTVAPTSPADIAAVLPGTSAQVTWQVTPASGQTEPITTDLLSASASYELRGMQVTSPAAGMPVTVAGPVQAPYKTTLSPGITTPAHFAQAGNAFTIEAAGTDVWCCNPGEPLDQYGAIYRQGAVGSNATVTVRVTHQDNTDSWAKSGLMVRNDIAKAGQSPGYVIMAITPGNGVDFGWDDNGGGYIDNETTAGQSQYPIWLRLVKNGSTFTGYYSYDGNTWNEAGTTSIPDVAATQDAGMFVSSHTTSAARVDMSDFSVAPGTQ